MAITWKYKKVMVAAGIGAIGLLSTTTVTHAQEISRGAIIGATCYTCHGTHGVSPGTIPSINEISAERMIILLKNYRSGQRASTVMGRHISGYTDEEITDVAQYLGNLQKRGK